MTPDTSTPIPSDIANDPSNSGICFLIKERRKKKKNRKNFLKISLAVEKGHFIFISEHVSCDSGTSDNHIFHSLGSLDENFMTKISTETN